MVGKLKKLLRRLLRLGPAEPPRDPYANVRAPIKPKRPRLSGSVALAEPDNE